MIEFSQTKVELTKALLGVQKQVARVKRDATNPHFRSRYATLENVVAALRGPCVENGLVITQSAGRLDGGMVPIETQIIHESGEWLKSTIALPVTKQDAQGIGSAITYGCRYSLMSLFCLPPADDDGNAAVERNNGKPAEQTTAGGITTMHQRTVSDGRQKSSSQAKKDKDEAIIKSMEECESVASLDAWMRANRDFIELLPTNWQNVLHEKFDTARAEFLTEEENGKSRTHKQLEESVNIIGGG